MFYQQIVRPFVYAVRDYPLQTAFSLHDEDIPFAVLSQRIVPIMNELDAISDAALALEMQDDVEIYAAVLACWFCGKTLIPVAPDISIANRHLLLKCNNLTDILSLKRISYFYRMTYDDALSRLDDGLPLDADATPACLLMNNAAPEKSTATTVLRSDIAVMLSEYRAKKEKYLAVDPLFRHYFPDCASFIGSPATNILLTVFDMLRTLPCNKAK